MIGAESSISINGNTIWAKPFNYLTLSINESINENSDMGRAFELFNIDN